MLVPQVPRLTGLLEASAWRLSFFFGDKTLSPKKDLNATMGTDCMFNQSDLWEEGSSLLVWLKVYMQWESCPVGFPHALYGTLHMSGFQRLKENTLTHDNRPIRYNHPRMAKG